MKDDIVPVTVKILDKDYRIACAANHKESLEDSASLLNDKMLEIKTSGKVIGSDRIAVMAALNLAHELLQQQQQTVSDNMLSKHLRQLREKVDGAVNESKQMEIS